MVPKLFVPPYLVGDNPNIYEQRGYVNSLKFSIYHLNNQSTLDLQDQPQGFEDQVVSLQATSPEAHNNSQAFEAGTEYFPTQADSNSPVLK